MTMKRIFPVALGLAMFAFASVQGYAFMLASTEVATPEGQFDVQKLVSDLTKEFASMSDEAKLASLQGAMSQIDGALDQGAVNEEELLSARQTLVAMQATVGEPSFGGQSFGEPIVGQPIDGQPIVNGDVLPLDGGFSGGGFNGGGMAGGGGGFGGAGGSGGAIGGGGGFGPLGAAALAAAIAVPVATSADDDTPGSIATVTQ